MKKKKDTKKKPFWKKPLLITKKTIEQDLNDKDIKYIQNYLLNQIEILLTCPNENIKYMLNYIVVGGLSLVIPEIKEQYPDFCFAF